MPLPVLDQRLRGTAFVDLSVKSVVNSPESTGMGFWSLNVDTMGWSVVLGLLFLWLFRRAAREAT